MRSLVTTFVAVLAGLTAAGGETAHGQAIQPATRIGVTAPAFMAVSVADLDASSRWYRTTFGLDSTTELPAATDGSVRTRLLQSPELVIEISQHATGKPLRDYAGGPTPGFLVHGFFKHGLFVQNLDRAAALLRERGVTSVSAVQSDGNGLRWVLLRDVEGNFLQLLERGQAAKAAAPNPDPTRFEKDIAAFEAQDKTSPPATGGTLFVGSSSITQWDVAREVAELKPTKRGYGGSHVTDTIHFAPRIIWPYKPSLIVFYAGDADVAGGKNADQIASDTAALLALIHKTLPQTRVVVIGTKPSPLHWKHQETIRSANAQIQAAIKGDPLAAFADPGPALLGAKGLPRSELYQANGLNLNEAGYQAWTAALRPVIVQAAKQ